MNNVKHLSSERGMTQQALADAVGTNQQAINGYKNRGIEPDFEILNKLADSLNTPVDYLLGRTENRCYNILESSFIIREYEITLIKQFRNPSPDVQKHIKGLLMGI